MRATPPSVSACVREKEGGGGRPRETKVCETRDDNDERDSDPAWRRCEIRERELRSGEWRLKSQTPRVRRVRSARASSAPSSRTQLGGSELAVLCHLAPDRTAAPRATASRPTCGPRVAGSDLVRDIKKTSMSAAYPPRETRRTSRPRARTGLHPTQTYMTIIDI